MKHKLGETEVALNTQKVVIFDIGTLETYYELEIPVTGVTNDLPRYLSEYEGAQYAQMGGIKSPDITALSDMKPDLIIISGRQSPAYDSLSVIAPTLFLDLDATDNWNSFEKNVQTIARIHGKEAAAERKLAVLRAKRDLVIAKTKDDQHKTLIVMHVRGGHTAYGSASRFGFIHDVLGFQQAMTLDSQNHTGHQFKEGDGLVEQANPAYLFLIDRDSAVGGKEKTIDQLLSAELQATTAYKNRKVFYLPGDIWYVSGGGLYSVEKQITDIGEQVYGIDFN